MSPPSETQASGLGWSQCLNTVLGDKNSMKCRKVLKRAVRLMRKTDSRPKKMLHAELESALTSGHVGGFVIKDDRVSRTERPTSHKRKREEIDVTVEGVKDAGEAHPVASRQPKTDTQVDTQATADQGGRNASDATPELYDKRPDQTWKEDLKRTRVKSGLYSKSEENTLREAVRQFAIDRNLPLDDFSWVISTGNKHRSADTKGIWTIVAKSLPQRTIKSVAAAGVRLFHPYAIKGAWTEEEDASLRAMVESLGTKWTKIAAAIQRTPEACRFRWREIRLGASKNTGLWTKDEEARLTEAVEKFGKPVKAPAGDGDNGPSDRRILLDNINWEAVVAHMKTRSRVQCITKWYLRQGPTMMDRGDWGPGDDKKLLSALWKCGKEIDCDVPWDSLVSGRTASQCKRRWAIMKKRVKNSKDYEFGQLVQKLVELYLPNLLKEQSK
ncbi:RNA polymerase I termination factor [Picochlorum sp. SENEW3]|nr:RNA polymerase I termination factor [Picochlorum sp. SENEW3]WPT18373.1 RNA polymerase I termination factor [Picochlorum sp. SENEW3]